MNQPRSSSKTRGSMMATSASRVGVIFTAAAPLR
jgi:hypothetical protein